MPDNVRDALPLIFVAALVAGVVAYAVLRSVPHRLEVAALVTCVGAIIATTQMGSDGLVGVADPLGPGGVRRAATWWADRPDVFPVITSERFLNVVAFVPVGFLVQRIDGRWRRALVAVAAFSFLLECGQAATRARVADSMDVVVNVAGGAIGVGLAVVVGQGVRSRVRR